MAFAQVCMAAGSADTAPIPEGAAHWRKEPQMNNPEPVGLCVICYLGCGSAVCNLVSGVVALFIFGAGAIASGGRFLHIRRNG